MEYTKYRKLIQGLFILNIVIFCNCHKSKEKPPLTSGFEFSGRAGMAVCELRLDRLEERLKR